MQVPSPLRPMKTFSVLSAIPSAAAAPASTPYGCCGAVATGLILILLNACLDDNIGEHGHLRILLLQAFHQQREELSLRCSASSSNIAPSIGFMDDPTNPTKKPTEPADDSTAGQLNLAARDELQIELARAAADAAIDSTSEFTEDAGR